MEQTAEAAQPWQPQPKPYELPRLRPNTQPPAGGGYDDRPSGVSGGRQGTGGGATQTAVDAVAKAGKTAQSNQPGQKPLPIVAVPQPERQPPKPWEAGYTHIPAQGAGYTYIPARDPLPEDPYESNPLLNAIRDFGPGTARNFGAGMAGASMDEPMRSAIGLFDVDAGAGRADAEKGTTVFDFFGNLFSQYGAFEGAGTETAQTLQDANSTVAAQVDAGLDEYYAPIYEGYTAQNAVDGYSFAAREDPEFAAKAAEGKTAEGNWLEKWRNAGTAERLYLYALTPDRIVQDVMTQAEVDNYNYYFATGGEDAASEYIMALAPFLKERYYQAAQNAPLNDFQRWAVGRVSDGYQNAVSEADRQYAGEIDRNKTQVAGVTENMAIRGNFEKIAKDDPHFKEYAQAGHDWKGNVLTTYLEGGAGLQTLMNIGYGAGFVDAAARQAMTQDEIDTYNYWYYAGGEDVAAQYMQAILPDLTARKGHQGAVDIEGKNNATVAGFEKAGHTAGGGVYKWYQDMNRFLHRMGGDTEYTYAPTSFQVTGQELRQNMTGAEAFWHDMLGSAAYMAPTIALSAMTGGAAAAAAGGSGLGAAATAAGAAQNAAQLTNTGLVFATASGSAYNEAKRLGYSTAEADKYAMMCGASEALMTYALTGISAVGGGQVTNAVEGRLSGAIQKVTQNPVAQQRLMALGSQLAAGGGEALEEYLQQTLDPVIRNIALGEQNQITLVSDEQIQAAVMGFLMSEAFNAPADIQNEMRIWQQYSDTPRVDALVGAEKSAELKAQNAERYVTPEGVVIARDETGGDKPRNYETEAENGIINNETALIGAFMDEYLGWEPYVIDRATGKKVPARIEPIDPKPGDYEGWNFDWSAPAKNGYEVAALYAGNGSDVQGMVAFKPDKSSNAIKIDIIESAPDNAYSNPDSIYKGSGESMIAYVCHEAQNQGFDAVYLKSKTNRLGYYESLGAVPIFPGSLTMIFEGENFDKLIEKYYGEGK